MIFPDAKRVLLTAYADTEAAITAINDARLDYYLLSRGICRRSSCSRRRGPAHDLGGRAALAAGGTRVIGHRFSRDTHELRDFLACA